MTERQMLLDDARQFVKIAAKERRDGFRAQAAECLTIAGNLRRYVQSGISRLDDE